VKTGLSIREVPIVPTLAEPPVADCLVVAREPSPVRIFVTSRALWSVWIAVTDGPFFVERGGHLVGRYCIKPDGTRRFIIITDAVPAIAARASGAHIEIAPDHWIAVHRELASRPGLRVLGWYHSHPGGWVGMSEVDRETQRAQFNVDWQVGLVIAPHTGRFRFYQGGGASRAPWVAITSQSPQSPEIESVEKR
jgi:proteasome lid subunit RPN8/RPN11